ncbi:MAG: hypothetical protein SV186_00010 [Candidatus Nanohaloarchaea archaeon]|nr:hypothetical protein [Candidatus Nanohaloarchaea archaeon]
MDYETSDLMQRERAYHLLRDIRTGGIKPKGNEDLLTAMEQQGIIQEADTGYEIDCNGLYRMLCARCVDLADEVEARGKVPTPDFAEDELARDSDSGPAHNELCRFVKDYTLRYLDRVDASTIDDMLLYDLHEALSTALQVNEDPMHPQAQQLFDFLDSVILTTNPAYFAVKETVDELWD